MTIDEFIKKSLENKIVCYYFGRHIFPKEIGFIYDIVKAQNEYNVAVIKGNSIVLNIDSTGLVELKQGFGEFKFNLAELKNEIVLDISQLDKLKKTVIMLCFGQE